VPRDGLPITPGVRSQDAPACSARFGIRFQDFESRLIPEISLHNFRSRFYPILALKLESRRSPTSRPRPKIRRGSHSTQ
jgi:hypothetical protein